MKTKIQLELRLPNPPNAHVKARTTAFHSQGKKPHEYWAYHLSPHDAFVAVRAVVLFLFSETNNDRVDFVVRESLVSNEDRSTSIDQESLVRKNSIVIIAYLHRCAEAARSVVR